jgi:hypothetical protein
VRLDAAKHLSELVFGRAASQTEQVAAEGAEAEREAIRALSDLELQKRIAAAWRLPALPEDATIVTPFSISDMARVAWESTPEDE